MTFTTSLLVFEGVLKKSPRGIELNKFIIVNPGKEIALLKCIKIHLFVHVDVFLNSFQKRQAIESVVVS